MTDDWKSQLGDLVGEDVEIAIGEEYVATPYQADGDIEVHLSRSWQPGANKE